MGIYDGSGMTRLSSAKRRWTLPRFLGRVAYMSTNAERLAEAVRKRREELDLTQLDVHAAGGPSNTTQTDVENARIETLSRVTARKLDAGLQWEPGSAKRVWNGEGEPRPILSAGMDAKTSAYLREQIGQSVLDEATKRELLEVLDRGEVRGA